ncbi:hypothetical protein PIB30_036279 [Stylosanthes scabra]|uniref:Uncharacterized protein n=1 Tax=Stylosanthes scabra TaxID=79078 RepID=A0ABU6ZAE8_9FABA|nr:hypothetical protein [Stylosanthes scabra]
MAAGVPHLSPALWGDDDHPRGRGLSAWAYHGRGALARCRPRGERQAGCGKVGGEHDMVQRQGLSGCGLEVTTIALTVLQENLITCVCLDP